MFLFLLLQPNFFDGRVACNFTVDGTDQKLSCLLLAMVDLNELNVVLCVKKTLTAGASSRQRNLQRERNSFPRFFTLSWRSAGRYALAVSHLM